jgi:hypothetical protein
LPSCDLGRSLGQQSRHLVFAETQHGQIEVLRIFELVTQPVAVWMIGPHQLICGDYRDFGVVRQPLGDANINLVLTSSRYATQRKYDPSSGFGPVPPEEYVA